MKLQEEINKINERIEALNKDVQSLVNELEEVMENEFPQEGDKYWYINQLGIVLRDEWLGFVSDGYMIEIGNVFETEQDAHFAAEKLKVEAELRKYSTEYQPYAEIYNIVFHNNSKKVITVTANQTFQDITFYFESKEKAQQAIESVGEERIKKYIFSMGD